MAPLRRDADLAGALLAAQQRHRASRRELRSDDRRSGRARRPTSTQPVEVLHEMMARVGERIAYKAGVSTVETTAAEALGARRRRGAGQRARLHRLLPPPRRSARYVSGYLRNDDAELLCRPRQPFLGRGLDTRARMGRLRSCQPDLPRGDHLRVAVGLDYRDAAPVSGRRMGLATPRMTVEASSDRLAQFLF